MGDPTTAVSDLDFARRHVAAGEARVAELASTAARMVADGHNPRVYEDAVDFYSDVCDHWRRALARLEDETHARA